MINDRLIAALSEIDDEMIIDAAPGRQYGQTGFAGQPVSVSQSERVQRRRTIYRFAAFAACVCVVVAVLAVVRPWSTGRNDPVPNTGNNETVDPGTNQVVFPAMPDYSACKGSESVEADKALAIIGEYPDQPEDLNGAAAGGPDIEFIPVGTIPGEGFIAAADVPEKLAVYWQKEANFAGFPKGLNKAQMKELIDTYADRLGIKIDAVSEFTSMDDDTRTERPVWLEAQVGDITIRAEASGHVMIQIPKDDVPGDLNSILKFAYPVISEAWSYRREDDEDGSAENVVYKLRVYVYTDQEDPLKYASIAVPSVSADYAFLHITDYGLVTEKVADYPVISPAKALEKLKAGEYSKPLKNDNTSFPGEEHIVGLRIDYYLSPVMEYIIPFYVYTVMLPDVSAEEECLGLKDAKCYVEYYIPAIDERYFESPAMTWN